MISNSLINVLRCTSCNNSTHLTPHPNVKRKCMLVIKMAKTVTNIDLIIPELNMINWTKFIFFW